MVTLAGVFVICVFALLFEMQLTKRNHTLESNNQQRIINIITICVLILVAGMRNVGGTDFNVYRIIYRNAPKLWDFFRYFSSIDDRYAVFGMERGYLFLNSFFKTIGVSYYGFIFVHSLFVISLIYFATREYTNNFTVVIFIVLYKMYFYDFFISIRQTTTIALFMLMMKDIERQNWKRYYILWILCYLTHNSSIMLSVVYFIGKLNLSKKLLIRLNMIFIPMIIISYLNVPVLRVLEPILNFNLFSTEKTQEKAENLIMGGNVESINWLHTIEYFGVMFFLVKFYDEIKDVFPKSDIMIKMFICLLPIFTLFRNYILITRIKDYFTISYGFILSYLCMIRKGQYKQLVYLATIGWCGFGYFRYINAFDGGALKNYVMNIFLGRSFFE
ncbi:MAG: EpsG family protein [bacterium]|nr:EpsG family protein [bacterium]